jgi:hypothetical protein
MSATSDLLLLLLLLQLESFVGHRFPHFPTKLAIETEYAQIVIVGQQS